MTLLSVLGVLAAAACGDDGGMPVDAGVDAGADAAPTDDAASPTDAGGPRDHASQSVPASTVPEPGVRREIFRVAGATPPPNPDTSDATPAELSFTQVVRYRQDEDPPSPARAILIAYPGFLGGGPSFDALARALVLRGAAAGEPVEVWAIDRRSNLLEDLRGMDTAEAAGDPEIAHGYYLGDDTIDGAPFPGYEPQTEVGYMSEWGLAVHAEDLRRVIALVPAEERQQRVFLVGHSLGGAFTEAYAAWRFEDGTRGVEELAGLVLIDGRLGDVPATEEDYLNGRSGGLAPSPGLTAIRMSTRYVALPILGIDVFSLAETLALRTLVAPEAVVEDPDRDRTASLLLSVPAASVPAFTNRGAFGWAFDTQSNPLAFAAASVGNPTGGSVEEYMSLLAPGRTVTRPSDPDAVYDWVDAPDASPPEPTPLANLAHAWVDGRSNFAEWYFPARLSLDLGALAGGDVPEDDWRADNGLRAFDRDLIDAPVLAIAAALVGAGGYATLASRLGPTVGAGRPHEGATRDTELGLRIIDLSTLSHLDPLVGDDSPLNPTAAEIERFVDEHAATGGIVIEAMVTD